MGKSYADELIQKIIDEILSVKFRYGNTAKANMLKSESPKIQY
jgi:hypothetical protein